MKECRVTSIDDPILLVLTANLLIGELGTRGHSSYDTEIVLRLLWRCRNFDGELLV